MKLQVVYVLAIVEIAWASETVKFPSTAVISKICGQAIGISNSSIIPNSRLKALSVYKNDYPTYGPHLARLHQYPGYRAHPLVHNNSWIMVDLGENWIVTGIATQGYGDENVTEWVTEYVIMTSSGYDYSPLKDLDTKKKVFIGNNDSSSVKFNGFPIPVIASSVTLYPTKWHKNIALRMEIYGCKPGYHIQAMVSPIGFPFYPSYLDPTSVDYISLAADIQHEVAFLSQTIPGFLSAKVIRFNPWNKPNVPKLQTEAEVEIQCIVNTTDYYEFALQEKVSKEKVFLDPNRLFFHHLNNKDYQCAMTINLRQQVSNPQLMLTTGNLSIVAKHQCKVFKKTYGRWEAAVMYESSKTFSPLIPLPGHGGKVTLEGHKYPPSLVYVRHVIKTEQIEVYSYGLVKIDRPPLVVKITGPTEVKKGQGVIILDASKSFDPDTSVIKDQDEDLVFTWFCKREDDFSYAQYSARRRQRYRFRYLYTKKFMRSIPADVQNGRPFTDDGCFGFGPGRLSKNTSKLEVPVDTMKSKYDYIFRVVVSKGRRKTAVEHTLRINPSVVFKVRCTSNCKKIEPSDQFETASQFRNLILDTKCIGRQCPTISSYRWKVFTEQRSSVNGSWWREEENLNNFTEGFRHKHSLILTRLQKIGNWKTRNQRIKIRATIKIMINKKILEEEDELTLVLNSPPQPAESNKKGCELTPSYGKAWSTTFHIKCGEWQDENGPVYFEFRYKRSNNIVIIKTGTTSSVSTRLPRGIKENNDLISVQVKIYDKTGDYTMMTQEARVVVTDYTDLADKIRGIIKDTDTELDNLVKTNQTTSANELAIALCSVVDTSDTTDGNKSTSLRNKLGVTKEVATKLKNKILEKLDASRNTTNWEETTQILTVVNLATVNPDEISPEMQEKASRLVSTTKDFLEKEIRKNGGLSELARTTSLSFIRGIGNLLQSFSNAMRNAPEMDHYKRLRNRENTEKALQELRDIGDTLLTNQKMDENPRIYNAKTISVIVSKNSPSMLRKMSGTPLKSFNNRKVLFPSLGAIFDSTNASSLSSVQSKIIMLTNNPFTWDSTADLVNSWAIDINLYNNGKHFEVTNLNNPIGIFIPEDTPTSNLPIAPSFIKPTKNASDVSRLRYHTFNIQSKHSAVMIRIQPTNGRKLEVFVRARERPLPWEYNYTTVVPDFRSCQRVVINDTTLHVNCTTDPYMFNISSSLTGKTGKHFVGIRYLDSEGSHQEVRQRLRRDCGAGRRKKRSCVGVKDPPTIPVPTRFIIPEYNKTTDINYTLSISSSSCLYWSERKQLWTERGCKPGPLTVKGSIHCLCNHLTTFGGDFFIQPNPIDFDKVLLTLTNPKIEDFVVMTTVIVIVILYLIGLIIARRADKNDERKAIPEIYLSDRGDYLYEISVATGVWRGNGTTANVGIILYGDSGYTETINLNDTTLNKKFFARGSINTFMLYLPKGLGNLYKIKIWHDNSGISPAWFLRQVEIRDQQESSEWIFLVNNWLALEKGDGEIETEVRAAEKKEIRGFKNVFHSRASNSLADGHLWASVFMRPPQSTFTRVQRLSCCLSIIFATMVTNAMFYQFGGQVHDTFKLGPLKVSWTQVKIGLQSALIAIPVNAIIVTIFRNARPKDNSPSQIYQAISTIAKGQTSDKSQGLRHGFVYLGWFLCIGTSIASATVIILYSLSWGGETANEWLTSILVSLVQDIFFTQPIKVILIASLLALLIKKPPDLEKARGSPRWKNKLKQKKVATLKGEELEKARLARKKIFKTARAFTEIVTYVLFAILLFIVCYGNRKTARFVLKDEMVHVMRGYDRVKNIRGFWNWTEMIFIPGIYNATWYNGKPFSYEEGFISNRESYLVGMPRIRQLRIKTVKCMISEDYPALDFHIPRCLPFYKPNTEYKTKYHKPDWEPVHNISIFKTSFDLKETCPRPWRYQEATALNALAYKGLYASYSGGGYVADLGYSNKSASRVVADLKKKEWIDNRTAAVFVELTVFEPATLLYSAVKVLFERLPTGSLKPAIRVEPLTVYGATDPGFKNVYQTCQLIFVLIVTILFACECFKVYRKGCTYFLRFWSWLDLILITSALLAMGTLFFKEKYVSDFIKGVHENPFQTTSTDFIVLWSNIEVYLLSFVIFIMTIKFLRLLRFNSHIGNLMLTLKHSTKNLQSFYVVMFIVLVAYTQVGMLLFGRNIEYYSTFIGSLSIVLQKLLGTSIQLRKVQRVDKVLGSIYTFAYSVTVALLLLNIFLSILNTSYKEVRESRRKRHITIALRKYIEDYMKSFYRELMNEFRDIERRWKTKGDKKLDETDNLISKEPLEASDDESIEAGELCLGAEEVIESDPLFELVENEQNDIIRYLVPLATFDNEDDILGELACLDEIKTQLRNIERDLLQATKDDDLSDDVNAEIVDNKSEESFKVGSQLSVYLSIVEPEPEKVVEQVEKDDISLYSVYSNEEGGISDEQDDGDEKDLYNAFHSKSGIYASLNSINELCAKVEQEKANTQLLSPHRGISVTPRSLRM